MATRRPRVKVAANLSIRRPTKTNLASNVTGETIKQEAHVTPAEPVKEHAPKDGVVASDAIATTPAEDAPMSEPPDVKAALVTVSVPETPREETFQEFKLPKPVEQSNPQTAPPCLPGYDAISSLAISSEGEPMSPRRQDTRPTFTLPLARKRNRTESLTSNKSLPEGVTVNKVTRKVATKQEESQRTLDNKKEIRKRLTNIENVDKQNLTMFDMIYYNPVNNPMTPPALSKRGSLENLPKSVDGREGRSRSVSKSRSPTPAPSSSGPPPAVAPKAAAAPVSLTPQLKLGPNGEMILDEASLVIENEREKEMRETLANADIVFQDEFSGNSGYYSRIRRTKDWGDEETIRFYRCLHTIGTDFSMMLTLFPQRSRRDLKLKFKKEERINLNLVNKALCHPNEFNVDDLRQQFAEEDEQLEKQRQEEQQRKQEALEQQQKEQLRKKLMMKITASNNPQRKISKSERVLTDGSEVIGEEIKQPKPRKSQARKRTAVKADPGPVSENASIENEQLQQSLEPVSNANTMAVEHTSRTNPVNNEPAENAPKEESSKKRQRASTGSRKQAAAATEGTKGEQAAMLPEQYSTVVANCSENLATVNGAVEQPLQKSKRTSVPKKQASIKQPSSTADAFHAVKETQSESISEHLPENSDGKSIDTPHFDVEQETSVKSAPKKRPTPIQSPAPLSPDNADVASGASEDEGQLVIEEQKYTPDAKAAFPEPDTSKTTKQKSKRKRWQKKRFFGKKRPCLVPSKKQKKKEKPPPEKPMLLDLPEEEPVIVKKDASEDYEHAAAAAAAANLAPDGPFNDPTLSAEHATGDQPFVVYEPAAAATYDNDASLNLPIVKYQCMEDLVEEDAYRPSDEMLPVSGLAVSSSAHSSVVAQQQKQQEQQDDDSITVITLQNLDDQTHTTCAPSVQPTLISELTPVEIKYDEYDPEGQLVLALDDADSIVKKELHNATLGGARSEPVNVHVINWPPEAGTAPTEAIPYVLYGKLESYGCSSNTFVIPDEMVQSQGQYAMVTPTTIVNVAPPIEQPNAGTSTPAAASTYRNVDIVAQSAEAVKPAATVTSCCYETIDVTPKHELPVHHLPENNLHHTAETIANGGETNAVVKSAAPEVPSEPEPCKVDPVDDNPPSGNDKVEEVEEQQEHEEGEEEEDGDGGFSLEDIDINSLVLVESQDSVDPNKTFYEIYVSNPDTGQLSEKPLDVPADVIESIRQILEGGATGGER